MVHCTVLRRCCAVLLLNVVVLGPYVCRAGHFDGRNHRASKPCIAAGDNILTIDFVHIWDNGEGKDPWGAGSDYAPYPNPTKPWQLMKHGPYGNIHVVVYSPSGQKLHEVSNLPGPEWTGSKYEWLDNQWMSYRNFGIYDWDWFPYTTVTVRLYESDPGPFREHDDLIVMRVQYKPLLSMTYESDHVPDVWLTTRNLPDYESAIITGPSMAFISNEMDAIHAPLQYFDGREWHYVVLQPYSYIRVRMLNGGNGTLKYSCWSDICQYVLRPGRKYLIDGYNVYEQ